MKSQIKNVRVLVANGVNLDLLGRREPDVYGDVSLPIIEKMVRAESDKVATHYGFEKCEIRFFQTNNESAFLESLDSAGDGAILNPGAWTHTSLALADRLAALKLPFVEVHISNLARRESIRHQSHSAQHAVGVVYGFGGEGYLLALHGLLKNLAAKSMV